MSDKKQLVRDFLLENESEKRIYLDDKDSNPDLYITVKGLSLAEILVGDTIVSNLWKNIANEDNSGQFVSDELFREISENSYKTFFKCLVDDEDKKIYNQEIYDELPETIKNEIILAIIEMTIPSKKKLLILKNAINRVDKKAVNLMETKIIQDLMKKRLTQL